MRNFILMSLVILFTCIAQLMQKMTASEWYGCKKLTTKITSLWFCASLMSLALALLFWLLALQDLPISKAYPILSLNFVLVSLAGKYLYKEKTPSQYWLGIFCIVIGVILVAE